MTTYGDQVNQAIAAELRAQRARVGITIDELVTATGLSKTSVLNYLNSKRDIPMPAFAELCRALRIDQVEIFRAAQKAL